MNPFKMGYVNKSKTKATTSGEGTEGPQGPRGPVGPVGPAGVGFNLTAAGNFDIQSKKLENVSPATNNSDVVVKSQVFVVDGNGNIDLKDTGNVVNSKQRTLNELKTHYDSLVSFEEVKENFLSRVETFTMGTQLDMNHHSITNLGKKQQRRITRIKNFQRVEEE